MTFKHAMFISLGHVQRVTHHPMTFIFNMALNFSRFPCKSPFFGKDGFHQLLEMFPPFCFGHFQWDITRTQTTRLDVSSCSTRETTPCGRMQHCAGPFPCIRLPPASQVAVHAAQGPCVRALLGRAPARRAGAAPCSCRYLGDKRSYSTCPCSGPLISVPHICLFQRYIPLIKSEHIVAFYIPYKKTCSYFASLINLHQCPCPKLVGQRWFRYIAFLHQQLSQKEHARHFKIDIVFLISQKSGRYNIWCCQTLAVPPHIKNPARWLLSGVSYKICLPLW